MHKGLWLAKGIMMGEWLCYAFEYDCYAIAMLCMLFGYSFLAQAIVVFEEPWQSILQLSGGKSFVGKRQQLQFIY